MIPSTVQPTDEIEKIVEKATSGLNEKLDKLGKLVEESKQKPREEKTDDILAKIRAKQEAAEKIKSEKVDTKKEESKEHSHEHDDINCPTCGKGHVHKMIGEGLKIKCTGAGCGDEFVMVPIQPDHECKTCKFPIKMPKNVEIVNNDPVIKAHAHGLSCPNCGGTTAIKLPNILTFDFSKLLKNKQRIMTKIKENWINHSRNSITERVGDLMLEDVSLDRIKYIISKEMGNYYNSSMLCFKIEDSIEFIYDKLEKGEGLK
jgi:hypothetical protein